MTEHNQIAISSGHGLKIRGASGSPVPPYLDEVNEARKVVDRTAAILREAGITVHVFHDDKSTTQSENLTRICDWHNAQKRTLDCSVHFNAYETTSKPMGTECLYKTQDKLAGQIAQAMADAGKLINRGPKYRSDLKFLNSTTQPAVLVETVFVDSRADADLYRAHFEALCHALAATLAGKELGEPKPPSKPPIDVPTPPERPKPPAEVAGDPRPTISDGDYGSNVRELQKCLEIVVDGDFGPGTTSATQGYQRVKGLAADGVVGPQTWAALEKDFPKAIVPYPWPLPDVLEESVIEEITQLAWEHPISDYQWKDRGQAPAGYVKGLSLSYAQACLRYEAGDLIAQEMAKANSHNSNEDALSVFNSEFQALGMSNEKAGRDTLRHLWVLLYGLGMRESSGQHCCGRDQSASNTDSNTCEAGLYQSSWNFSTCCTDILNLFDSYESAKDSENECPQGYLDVWKEDVDCSSSDWKCYGSGTGYVYQQMAKSIPTFAVETTAIGLRNICRHWGPVQRKEVEIRKEADDLFRAIDDIVDTIDAD